MQHILMNSKRASTVPLSANETSGERAANRPRGADLNHQREQRDAHFGRGNQAKGSAERKADCAFSGAAVGFGSAGASGSVSRQCIKKEIFLRFGGMNSWACFAAPPLAGAIGPEAARCTFGRVVQWRG